MKELGIYSNTYLSSRVGICQTYNDFDYYKAQMLQLLCFHLQNDKSSKSAI